ncbi:hypothetical protein MGYG_01021 [Nannizzia gypsea CBS 118893]|uniref:Nuclear GTPase SLIP-GC n=1 Tax=Arthroderma gypseum (strain ATCC MYA-4604 / CBS 118893) TaxID=535722 RepID=E5R3S5_ARTGP|nr:hypothetical protein MGYG_01021 [Nannizzia gypsea CBS 118893]EFQ97985.1 hypothetical protein MGYG_01021 [Nannizzia gypsea CBS 118893]
MASLGVEVHIPSLSIDRDAYDDIEMSSSDAGCSSSDEETPANGQSPLSREIKPELPVVSKELEELERKSNEGFQILEKLEAILKKYSSSTRTNEALRKQILETMDQGKNHPTVTIGVVGATGAGKSSLINALLGEKRLVPTSGMRACTAAITEISYGNGPWRYEAEIQFISKSSWEEEMRLLFEDMRDGLDDLPSTYDSDFGVACAKFKAVYQLPLQDTQTISIEDLMRNSNVAAVLGSTKYLSGNNVLEFYEELRKYVDSEDPSLVSNQDTIDTTHMIPQNKPMQLWPLVELVRLRVKSPVLSTGAVLVDLPGLLDVNTARGTLAQKYIKNCSGLWVLAPITRAVDDHSARVLLGDGFKRQLQLDGGMSQLAFICSKTDDINLSEAADDPRLKLAKETLETFQKEKGEYIKSIRKKIYSLRKRDKRLNSKLDKLVDFAIQSDSEVDNPGELTNQSPPDQGFMNISPSPSPRKAELLVSRKKMKENQATIKAQTQSLEKDVLSYKNQIKLKTREFERCCIEKRNEFSEIRIKEDFVTGFAQASITSYDDGSECASEVPSTKEKLHVFCVSAKAFQILEGRLKEDKIAKGFITTEDTGISQLQRYCLNIGVAARTAEHNKFLNNVGQLANSVKLQASRHVDSLATQHNDKRLLGEELETLKDALGTTVLNMSKALLGVRQQLYADLDHAAVTAIAAADGPPSRWNRGKKNGGIAHSTYKAICRRSGEFRDGKGKRYDWGRELAEPMMAIIRPAWERAFIRQIPQLLNKISDSLRRDMGEFHRSVMRDVRTLSQTNSRTNILNDQCLIYKEKIRQTIHFVTGKMDSKQKDLNRIFIPTITLALRPAYSTVLRIKGAGSFEKIKDTIANCVADSKYDMFHRAINTIKVELEEFANALVDLVGLDVENVFDGMSEDYLTDLKNSSEMEKPLKEELISFLNSTSLFGDLAKHTDNNTPNSDFKPLVAITMDSSSVKTEPESMDTDETFSPTID